MYLYMQQDELQADRGSTLTQRMLFDETITIGTQCNVM
jgi:hypothetical protein